MKKKSTHSFGFHLFSSVQLSFQQAHPHLVFIRKAWWNPNVDMSRNKNGIIQTFLTRSTDKERPDEDVSEWSQRIGPNILYAAHETFISHLHMNRSSIRTSVRSRSPAPTPVGCPVILCWQVVTMRGGMIGFVPHALLIGRLPRNTSPPFGSVGPSLTSGDKRVTSPSSAQNNRPIRLSAEQARPSSGDLLVLIKDRGSKGPRHEAKKQKKRCHNRL